MTDLGLRARLELLPSAAGGRRGWIRSGWRPALWFGDSGPAGEPHTHSCLVELVDDESAGPGEVVIATLRPLAFETWPPVEKGSSFEILEGAGVVGHGTVIDIPEETERGAQVRRGLHAALEEWLNERFTDVIRQAAVTGAAQPDLVVHFEGDDGLQHTLIAEVKGSRLTPADVQRLTMDMDARGASLGVIVAAVEPSADVFREVL